MGVWCDLLIQCGRKLISKMKDEPDLNGVLQMKQTLDPAGLSYGGRGLTPILVGKFPVRAYTYKS
jgi:hypothetical protein